MLKFATTSADCESILAIYKSSSSAFNLGQTYLLIEMMLGLGYGNDTFKDCADDLIESVKIRDKTDVLSVNLKKFDAMRLTEDIRSKTMVKYMVNEGHMYSAADMETFACGFTSKYLPIDVRRKYYKDYFASLIGALRVNSNMYVKKMILGLTPVDDRHVIRDDISSIVSQLTDDDSYAKDVIAKLGV